MNADDLSDILNPGTVPEVDTAAEVTVLGFPLWLRPLSPAHRVDIRRQWDEPPHDLDGAVVRVLAASLCDPLGRPKWTAAQIEQQREQWAPEFASALADAITRVNRVPTVK